MHIFETAVRIPPTDTSWHESINFLFINFNIVSPLFFSLNKLTSGGGPFFSNNTVLEKNFDLNSLQFFL